MLAEKFRQFHRIEENVAQEAQEIEQRVNHMGSEELLESISYWMFKLIMIIGIPYFLFVLVKFIIFL
ncbi:hypothetical protein [Tuberibacillus sp. Marseille-P3662]|uniref:hypothetical protein n=1 Tax=Tuberibacillus sp. Marseille-P3662 TaxID=1965358 RepID=UPI000A1C9FCB|nr:hypothetical protein [Tuberibacillus sp. Marseille-P3662]